MIASTTSIGSLPEELFLEIVKGVIGCDQSSPVSADDAKQYGLKRVRALLAVTHVCRVWRRVSLDHPLLWAHITVTGNRLLLEAFLLRAGGCTVSVQWFKAPLAPGPYTTIFDLVRDHGSRIRRLELYCPQNVSNSSLQLLPFPTPLLRCLRYQCTSSPARAWEPQSIGDGNVATVEALFIERVSYRLPSNSFPNLTHLHLSLALVNVEETLTPLISFFSRLPAVEIVHLTRSTRYKWCMSSPSPLRPGRANLPHLRSMTLHGFPLDYAKCLLRHLHLPSTALVALQEMRPSPNTVDSLRACLASLNANVRLATHLDIAVTDEVITIVADGPSTGVWVNAYLITQGQPRDWIFSILKELPLQHIITLHIQAADFRAFHFHGLFPLLPELTTLRLVLSMTSRLAPLETRLFTCREPRAADAVGEFALALAEGNPPPCPKLTPLELCFAYFQPEITRDVVALLRDMLRVRRHRGSPHSLMVQPIPVTLEHARNSNMGREYREEVEWTDWICDVLPRFEELRRYLAEGGKSAVELPTVTLGAFEKRDVWDVEGAQRYWQVGQPEYHVEPWCMRSQFRRFQC